jgi:hypothetical protein
MQFLTGQQLPKWLAETNGNLILGVTNPVRARVKQDACYCHSHCQGCLTKNSTIHAGTEKTFVIFTVGEPFGSILIPLF